MKVENFKQFSLKMLRCEGEEESGEEGRGEEGRGEEGRGLLLGSVYAPCFFYHTDSALFDILQHLQHPEGERDKRLNTLQLLVT